jgi:hypothetical protein
MIGDSGGEQLYRCIVAEQRRERRSRAHSWAAFFGAVAPAGLAALVGAGALGCGSRTSLDVTPFASSPDAAADAPLEAAVEAGDASDANDAHDAGLPCGAPWVIFALVPVGPGEGPDHSRLYAIRADGTGGGYLELPQPNGVYPSVSPDGTALLYSSGTFDSLFVYHFGDGSEVKLLTSGQVGFGSISPDGTTVVYGDGANLWRVAADGSTPAQLFVPGTKVPSSLGYPVFTKDSKTVVFGALEAVDAVSADGTGLRTLLQDPSSGTFSNPALSPDNLSLVVPVACTDNAYALRVYPYASLPAACESGTVIAPVDAVSVDEEPAWGPTGLVAVSDGLNINLVDVASATETTLTGALTGPSTVALEPTWAPSCTSLPVSP